MLFCTRFSRPSRFSDPDEHFSSEELERVISVADSNMGWSEYRTIFHVGTPAGSFEEVAYFLPVTLEYMLNHPDDSLEFRSGVIFFISEYADQLKRAKILKDCLESIVLCFHTWTRFFVVEHYDEEACRRKGWGLKFDNIVQNSQAVSELVDDLWTYRYHAALGDELVTSLASSDGNAVKSAWFLEYSREVNSDYRFWKSASGEKIHADIKESFGISTDIQSSIPTSLSSVIPKIASDVELLAKHYQFVKASHLYGQVHPTYWQSIEKELDLHST